MTPYSIVVVAHNHAKQLLATLLAIKAHATPVEVLVIDNASSASLVGPMRLSQLPARAIRLAEHVSLGAAFNVGLDEAVNDLVLLLHSDALLLDTPSPAVEYLEKHVDVGIVGGKLVVGTQPPRRIRHAGYELGRGRVGVRSRNRGEWDGLTDTSTVDAVSDACMMLRRSDLRFDERYWFTLQDVDFCLQYRQAGQRVVSMPKLLALHSETGGVSERSAETWWATRHLASQLLYHDRWCNNLQIDELPTRVGVRGEAALTYFRDIDNRYTQSGDAA